MHLRQLCVDHDMPVENEPEVLVRDPDEEFDGEGRLMHDVTRRFVRPLTKALHQWVCRLGPVRRVSGD